VTHSQPEAQSSATARRRILRGTLKRYLAFYKTKDGQISEEKRMRDPNHLREQARRCRALARTAIEPELIEQLRVWSVELADEADAVERRATEGEQIAMSVWLT
jgi:hypothetical protein